MNHSETQKTLSVDQAVEAQHFQGRGLSPTATPGPGLGGGTVALQGTDAGFFLTLVVAKTAPGPLATVSFASTYQRPPVLGLCLLDAGTAKAAMLAPFYAVPSAGSVQIFADGLVPGNYQLSLVLMG